MKANLSDRLDVLEQQAQPPKCEPAPRNTYELGKVLAEINGEAERLASMSPAGRVAHWRNKVEQDERIIAAGGVVEGDDLSGASAATLDILRGLRVEIARGDLPELRKRLLEAEHHGELLPDCLK